MNNERKLNKLEELKRELDSIKEELKNEDDDYSRWFMTERLFRIREEILIMTKDIANKQ